jgi:conjugal transfer ATP-binding protein TraC
MFFKKRKENGKEKDSRDEKIIEIKEEKKESVINKGIRSIKDLISPSVDRSPEDCIKIDNKFVRSYSINGYPPSVSVGFLDKLYSYEGDIDVMLYIYPADDRVAQDDMNLKIAQYMAQLEIETRKGEIKNQTLLMDKIAQLQEQKRRLELNYENLFHVSIFLNIFSDTKEDLEKKDQMLQNYLRGRKILITPEYLRQDDSYRTTLPLGLDLIKDKYRNFNSGSLTACFPFYNSEVSHENGIFCGINLYTSSPVFLDFYGKQMGKNVNMTVIGKSGSGKTFFVSLLTLRSLIKGIRTAIIDPEGEYIKLTKIVGGSHVSISSESEYRLNPFDVELEDTEDGRKELKIKDKIADLLNLIAVMAGGLNAEQRSVVAHVLMLAYKELGIENDPESLFEEIETFDVEKQIIVHGKKIKTMPTISDFHRLLSKYSKEKGSKSVNELVESLKMFVRGGVYDLFDCHTSESLMNFKDAPIVTFDVSKLEESILRPIGMYVSMSWVWEKFVKKNIHQKKRVVCDEAWMLTSKSMAGHEYTSAFLEKASRRARKKNTGLLVASQNFTEFANDEQGRAVLTNAAVNIFLGQNSTDIDALQETFALSDGERNFLLQARIGEYLIRMDGESTAAFALAFDHEKDLITKAYVKKD